MSPPRPVRLPLWAALLLPVAVALLARAGLGYRPFPSIDDFAYFPIALHHADPSLFANDLLVRENMLHVPGWPLLVSVLGERLPEGLWLITLLLSVATVAVVFRLMRACGVEGLLLPLAVLLGVCVRVNGLGRATYDGVFGNGFHMQWLGLCLLLWTYDAFVRQRPLLAGLLLAVTVYAHPVVAVHGAVVLAIAAPWTGTEWSRRLAIAGLTTALLSLPATWPLAQALMRESGGGDVADVIVHGLLFRVPHEYRLDQVPYQYWLLLGLTLAGGLAGSAILAQLRPDEDGPSGVAGLFAGHLVLLVAAVALHGPWPVAEWSQTSLAPYVLHLTRTTGLAVLLAAILATAGVEAWMERALPQGIAWAVLGLGLMLTLMTLLMGNVVWNPWLGALAFMALLLLLMRRRRALLLGAGAAIAVAAGVAGAAVLEQPHRAEPPAEERALHNWARSDTPVDALFVVPPGLQGFRTFARRSVYVDFKIFVVGPKPELMREWRRRLELVAQPDKLALNEAGWLAVPQWDRAYALANTPARSVELLRLTGADYLVWDAQGLEVPPYLPLDRPAEPRLEAVYANARFTVYRLKDDGRG